MKIISFVQMRRYIEENTTVFPPALTSIHGPLNVFIQYIEHKTLFVWHLYLCREKLSAAIFFSFRKIISIIICYSLAFVNNILVIFYCWISSVNISLVVHLLLLLLALTQSNTHLILPPGALSPKTTHNIYCVKRIYDYGFAGRRIFVQFFRSPSFSLFFSLLLFLFIIILFYFFLIFMFINLSSGTIYYFSFCLLLFAFLLPTDTTRNK